MEPSLESRITSRFKRAVPDCTINLKTALSGGRELPMKFLIRLFGRVDEYLHFNLVSLILRFAAGPALILAGLLLVLSSGLFAYHPPVEMLRVYWALWIILMIYVGLCGVLAIAMGIEAIREG